MYPAGSKGKNKLALTTVYLYHAKLYLMNYCYYLCNFRIMCNMESVKFK